MRWGVSSGLVQRFTDVCANCYILASVQIPGVGEFMRHLSILLACTLCWTGYALGQEPNNPPPTFTKDVAPILQKHCETSHLPVEATPFPFFPYDNPPHRAPMIQIAVTIQTIHHMSPP